LFRGKFPDLIDKKSAPHFSGALLRLTQNNALIDYDKVRVALADHPLCVRKTVHVNRDPAAVQEHKVAVTD